MLITAFILSLRGPVAAPSEKKNARFHGRLAFVEMGDSNPRPLTCEAQKTHPAEQNRTMKPASDRDWCPILFAPVLGDSDQIGGRMAE
jgi:hypothetical protein